MRSLLSRWAFRLASFLAPSSARQTGNSNLKKDDSMGSTNYGLTLSMNSPGELLPKTAHLPETQRLVAMAAMNRLFSERHFSICQLDALIKLTGAQRDSQAYNLLRPLHCIDWSDMDPALRDKVPLLVREALLTNQWARDAAATAMSALEPRA